MRSCHATIGRARDELRMKAGVCRGERVAVGRGGRRSTRYNRAICQAIRFSPISLRFVRTQDISFQTVSKTQPRDFTPPYEGWRGELTYRVALDRGRYVDWALMLDVSQHDAVEQLLLTGTRVQRRHVERIDCCDSEIHRHLFRSTATRTIMMASVSLCVS